MSNQEWDHKDEWRKRGEHFLVTVSRHSVKPSEIETRGTNRWCVYAFIYPAHPHFSAFKGSSMWQEAATCLPFHAGPSFLRWHYNDEGKSVYVQVGADYNHLDDDAFCDDVTKADAVAQFRDAQELFDKLQAMAEGGEA